MSKDDDFSALVGNDVAPLKMEARELLCREKKDNATMTHRRDVAASEVVETVDPLGGEPIELLQAMDLLEFKRPGVQNGVYRKFRLGKYPVDARLDLHKLTVELARQNVYQFIVDCNSNDVRTALITHGKSEGRETPALPKKLRGALVASVRGGDGISYGAETTWWVWRNLRFDKEKRKEETKESGVA